MSIKIDGELHTITQSLESDHLGQAFDLLRESKEITQEQHSSLSSMKERRLAISIIIHSFCALESAINYFGYELFFDADSQRYVLEEQRDILLKKFVKAWAKGSTLEKFQFVVSYAGSRDIPDQLAAKLRELNILRNWLVHGFTYKTTFLLEPNPEEGNGSYTVVDYEETVDWGQKFPNCKFNSLNSLYFEDARKALVIVLESLELLSNVFSQPFGFTLTKPRLKYNLLSGPSFNIDKVIENSLNSGDQDAEQKNPPDKK